MNWLAEQHAASTRRRRHDCANRGRRRNETIILRRSEFAAHEHVRPAKPHAARARIERGEMDFLRFGRGDDPLGIAQRDTPARHHDDAAPRAANQFSDNRQSLENGRLLARSEHTIDAKRLERVASHVERPVKRHGKWPGKRNQFAGLPLVDLTCRRQQADDNAVGAFGLSGFDV